MERMSKTGRRAASPASPKTTRNHRVAKIPQWAKRAKEGDLGGPGSYRSCGWGDKGSTRASLRGRIHLWDERSERSHTYTHTHTHIHTHQHYTRTMSVKWELEGEGIKKNLNKSIISCILHHEPGFFYLSSSLFLSFLSVANWSFWSVNTNKRSLLSFVAFPLLPFPLPAGLDAFFF